MPTRSCQGHGSKGLNLVVVCTTGIMSTDLFCHDYGLVWDRNYFSVTEQRGLMPFYPRFSRDLPWVPLSRLKEHPRITALLDEVVTLFLVLFPHRRRLTRNPNVYKELLRDVSSDLLTQCLSCELTQLSRRCWVGSRVCMSGSRTMSTRWVAMVALLREICSLSRRARNEIGFNSPAILSVR